MSVLAFFGVLDSARMHAWLSLALCLSWSVSTGSVGHDVIAIASPDGASVAAEEPADLPCLTARDGNARRVLRPVASVPHPALRLLFTSERAPAEVARARVVDRRREVRRAHAGAAIPHLSAEEPPRT